jgi:hypothetical protein
LRIVVKPPPFSRRVAKAPRVKVKIMALRFQLLDPTFGKRWSSKRQRMARMGDGPAKRNAPATVAKKSERAACLVIKMRTKATIGGMRGMKSTGE